MQEIAFTWAEAQGVETHRSAKAIDFARNGSPSVRVAQDGRETEYRARLVVGADGKRSAARRWTGGESVEDPAHHRFGGVLLAGDRFERGPVFYNWNPGVMLIWFAAGSDHTRFYVSMPQSEFETAGIDRSFESLVEFASARLGGSALTDATQAGPLAFFPNSCTWASEVAGNGVVLIGDAAGAPDPSQGHGTSLVFWDVRNLSELLLESKDWDAAVRDFARRRRQTYGVIRTLDHWWQIFFDTAPEAMKQIEGHFRAREQDPTLGGLTLIEIDGPERLTTDEAARRRWFGEELS